MILKRLKKGIAVLLLMSVSLGLLTACKGIELENKTEQVEEYTREQAMILIANERNRYKNAYSGEIFGITDPETGTSFDKLLVANVKTYLENIKLLCMMAQEKGISVTSSERDQIRQMTDAYVESLTADDISFIGCNREDVQKMYTDYYTACKMAQELVGDSQTDISDSEVKVIRVMQIGTADLKKAKAILKKVKIDGSDFNSMASRYSELGQIEVEMKKGSEDDLLEQTAFSLEEGEISNILCKGEMYYIIKCINGYDREATQKRKNGLETALNSLSFQEALSPYKKEHNIEFFDSFWNDADITKNPGSEADGFFDIYKKYVDQ